jgi:hypothetical protein
VADAGLTMIEASRYSIQIGVSSFEGSILVRKFSQSRGWNTGLWRRAPCVDSGSSLHRTARFPILASKREQGNCSGERHESHQQKYWRV